MRTARLRRVARRPRLARAGIGRVPVGAQRLPVDPRVGDRVDDLVARAAHHVRDHRGRRDLHQHDVVEPDAVEAVLERDHALDLVRLDHAGQHVAHGERRLALREPGAREPVGDGEYAAQVVRGMSPFRREPGVVEIEPADHRADVECGGDRVELVRRARDLRAVRHHRSRNDRAEELGAGGILERFQPAAERVHQAQARRVVGLRAFDRVAGHVVGDVGQDFVGLGPDVGGVRRHALAQPTCFFRNSSVRLRASFAASALYEPRCSQLKPWPAPG